MTLHRFKLDKLVRDHFPRNMSARQISFSERFLDDGEYLSCLKDKLVEEVQEVVEATTSEALLEELADVLEVVHALGALSNFTYARIEEKRLEKKAAKGGFERRVYSAYVEMAVDNPSFAYYQRQPDKYPEV